jgi:hypothetical protein
MPLFRSTSLPGHSSAVVENASHVIARKREHQVQVKFATQDCVVQSQEGLVHAKAGDAILTGVHGEHWRVSKSRFAEKYRAAPPTRAGEDGTYVSRPMRVLALQMQESFDVLLADGRSTLHGARGDWLIDYGDGSLGIVSQAIFSMTYDLAT